MLNFETYCLLLRLWVLGGLKVGKKRLFIWPSGEPAQREVTATCVLDFYVWEASQRCGVGRRLFGAFLEQEGAEPTALAYDRPSLKCLSFLARHFGLVAPTHHYNYCTFPGFERVHQQPGVTPSLAAVWATAAARPPSSGLRVAAPALGSSASFACQGAAKVALNGAPAAPRADLAVGAALPPAPTIGAPWDSTGTAWQHTWQAGEGRLPPGQQQGWEGPALGLVPALSPAPTSQWTCDCTASTQLPPLAPPLNGRYGCIAATAAVAALPTGASQAQVGRWQQACAMPCSSAGAGAQLVSVGVGAGVGSEGTPSARAQLLRSTQRRGSGVSACLRWEVTA